MQISATSQKTWTIDIEILSYLHHYLRAGTGRGWTVTGVGVTAGVTEFWILCGRGFTHYYPYLRAGTGRGWTVTGVGVTAGATEFWALGGRGFTASKVSWRCSGMSAAERRKRSSDLLGTEIHIQQSVVTALNLHLKASVCVPRMIKLHKHIIYCRLLYFHGLSDTNFRGLNKNEDSLGSKFMAIKFSCIILTENTSYFVGTGIRRLNPPRKTRKLVPNEN